MLEQLTAHMDAWSKAAKQVRKGQPMGKPPARPTPRPPGTNGHGHVEAPGGVVPDTITVPVTGG